MTSGFNAIGTFLYFLVCHLEASVRNSCCRARKNKQAVITEPIQEKDFNDGTAIFGWVYTDRCGLLP
jgi:hypothetical protein